MSRTLPAAAPSRAEFVALMAMLMASIAFSLDAMLPAMPEIARDLTAALPNRAQLVVASFILGMGAGTIVMGPVSDAFGRKPVIVGSAAIYCLGAFLAWHAPTLEVLLAARLLQGLGAAGPRVTVMAIIRDLFDGRQMAQMMSFVIVVFTLVPAIAPTIGAAIIALAGWRALFLAFIVFSLTTAVWLSFRLPETLAPERRRGLRVGPVITATREVLVHPTVRNAILVQICAFGMLFGNISTTQQVFDQTFGRGESFPLWFALMAGIGAAGGMLNARIVVRVGMRDVITGTLLVQSALSAAFLAAAATGVLPGQVYFLSYLLWAGSIFACAGLVLGNINALALEPMGHIAGTAASVVAALGTIGAAGIAAGIGLAFDGTPIPVATGILICAVTGLILMQRLRREA